MQVSREVALDQVRSSSSPLAKIQIQTEPKYTTCVSVTKPSASFHWDVQAGNGMDFHTADHLTIAATIMNPGPQNPR